MYDFLLVRHCNIALSGTVCELFDVELYIYVTFKSGLVVTQGH